MEALIGFGLLTLFITYVLGIYEGIRRYPIVYYCHSRRAYRSLPFAFLMVGGMAGALRWGLPKGHPGSQTPWLPTLIIYLDERFLSEHLEDTPEPVPFETFEAAIERDKEPADPWLDRFLQIESFMRDLARLEDAPDPEEAYDRYKHWLPSARRNRSFFEASARDLGYELARGPGERLF